jgi:FixJ family two-component response regulator
MVQAARDTVAIVDDDEAVRHSLRFLLEVLGHKVETFASAAEFLKAGPGDLMCLIVDHHMPTTTGLDFAERLRVDGNKVPIMLITGSPTPGIYARAAKLAIEVLEKPPDEALLLAFIDAAKRRV